MARIWAEGEAHWLTIGTFPQRPAPCLIAQGALPWTVSA
jgi:hypothetical protein